MQTEKSLLYDLSPLRNLQIQTENDEDAGCGEEK
jgi:hypothetical protein